MIQIQIAYEWLRARFGERSTYLALAQGLAAAAAAPWPFNFMLFLGSIVAAAIADRQPEVKP